MKQYRINLDRAAGMWMVVDSASDQPVVSTNRLVLDAPAVSAGQCLVSTGDLEIHPDQRVVLTDGKTPPGTVKPHEMREWVTLFDEVAQKWVVYRQDAQHIVVLAETLELDCHGITSNGELHCLSEMLVCGKTNRRTRHVTEATKVRLRTLSEYDQVVHVQPIRSGSKVQAP